jgi:hypothetical protein
VPPRRKEGHDKVAPQTEIELRRPTQRTGGVPSQEEITVKTARRREEGGREEKEDGCEQEQEKGAEGGG